MKTSFSALETYLQCPLKFKYQEIEKRKAPKSKEAMLGTAVHQALHYYHGSGPHFPTLDDVLEYYRKNWVGEKVEWKGKDEERAYFEDGKKLLESYCTRNDPRTAKILDLEARFEAPLSDSAVKETHLITGKIDRVDKDDEGVIEIIDYKTAKRMPTQAQVDTSLQLSIYHLGLKQRWPELRPKKVKLSLYFLRHNEKLSTEGTEEKIEETKQRVLGVIRDIQKSDFSPTPGPLCDWCPYRPICPMWAHEYMEEGSPGLEQIQGVLQEYFTLKDEEKKNTKRLRELRGIIEDYYDRTGLERVFHTEGHVTRLPQKRIKYDPLKIKQILEPLGVWDEVLSLDQSKLKKIITSLPSPARIQLEAAKIDEKKYKVITATKKKKGYREETET